MLYLRRCKKYKFKKFVGVLRNDEQFKYLNLKLMTISQIAEKIVDVFAKLSKISAILHCKHRIREILMHEANNSQRILGI